MLEFDCPYCNYFLSEIDSEYLETHRELSFDYSIPIYPFGEYQVTDIMDIKIVSSFLLRNYYSLQYQYKILEAYRSTLIEAERNNLSNTEFSNMKPNFIKWIINIPSNIFGNIFSSSYMQLNRVLLNEGLPFLSKSTLSYQNLFSSIKIDYNNEQNFSLNTLRTLKRFNLTNSTDHSLFEKTFTLLYDTLIIVNSTIKSNEKKDLSLEIDIQEIKQFLDSSKDYPHSYNTTIIALKDINSISEINKEAYYLEISKLNRLIHDNRCYISMNYLKCLLLVTYYYAEYKDLFL